jgi:signal transduction histidine kinase
MNVTFIILIIVLSYLRKILKTKTELPFWEQIFQIGFISAIALLALGMMYRQLGFITIWIAHAMALGLLSVCLKFPELKPAKQVVYAILPLVITDFIEDLTEKLLPGVYEKIDSYFGMVSTASFIWLFIMLFVNNKQRKALERERKKAEQKEQEFQLSQAMKAQLEIQVAERTAELINQKNELQKTLEELTLAQAQLIQSEKMASLGELTAGIAHEIQNPLNFVNNFSEVSTELIKEMVEEVENGNSDEVKAIAGDLVQNLKKINHHGKRAADIVKGMLQHSRSSSGVKEPTDINALVDEYLRLAYHGLRAKDKTFNATMKTNFDESIGEVNVMPQDIGRVILNLITNAFYVVNEKAKQGIAGFEPTVSINTKKENNRVLLSVTDNGNGIPQAIREKIFQPFFTTKPTGHGTGLGLSLSYDIVKAHGGELRVETKEGEGSEFVIQIPIG